MANKEYSEYKDDFGEIWVIEYNTWILVINNETVKITQKAGQWRKNVY